MASFPLPLDSPNLPINPCCVDVCTIFYVLSIGVRICCGVKRDGSNLQVMTKYAAPGLFLRDDMHKLSKFLMRSTIPVIVMLYPTCCLTSPLLFTTNGIRIDFVFLDEDQTTLSDSPEVQILGSMTY